MKTIHIIDSADSVPVFRFADTVELSYESPDVLPPGEYVFGADIDRDINTAPCAFGTVTIAVDDSLILCFVLNLGTKPFMDKIQMSTQPSRRGFWEIRAADRRVIASGACVFEKAVIAPGFTPAPDPAPDYPTRPEVAAMIDEKLDTFGPQLEAIKGDTEALLANDSAMAADLGEIKSGLEALGGGIYNYLHEEIQ